MLAFKIVFGPAFLAQHHTLLVAGVPCGLIVTAVPVCPPAPRVGSSAVTVAPPLPPPPKLPPTCPDKFPVPSVPPGRSSCPYPVIENTSIATTKKYFVIKFSL
jgi:hypothetical protein